MTAEIARGSDGSRERIAKRSRPKGAVGGRMCRQDGVKQLVRVSQRPGTPSV